MKRLFYLGVAIFCYFNSIDSAFAQTKPDSSFLIPSRAVIVSGDKEKSGDLVAVLYDKSELHYTDPNAPRFLFLDREGKIALGIGGYLKGTIQYDFNGSIDDGASFVTYDIPVPNNPAQRSKFYGNVNHSTIFLQLVGRSSKFGYYQMYVQTNFTGNGKTGYGVKVKQAWASLGNVTMGLARSTFVDPSAGTPGIEDQGPTGEMTGKNVLIRYAKTFGKGWRVAAGIEMPDVSVTTIGTSTEKINPRVPDIPANIQYSWGAGSHVRLSGLLRNMSYRNLQTNKNKIKTGWAVQLSGLVGIINNLDLYFQGAYGRGYGRYINDFEDNGFDLVSGRHDGEMTAPKMTNFELGLKCSLSEKMFLAASYSQARLFDVGYLGGDTYRYGQYVSASGFYDIIPDLRLGVGYVFGKRTDFSGESGKANTVIAMLQYNF